MVPLAIADGRIQFNDRFGVSFQRTLRVPDDGRTYPLPPGLGLFPLHSVSELGSRAPQGWSADDLLLPMYQREALWIGFDGASWKPNAVKIGVGGINAVTGEAWRGGLTPDPQNYLVCPPQLWLDGINAGPGHIRQFVAMPIGAGASIGEQRAAGAETNGVQIEVFEPKPGRFGDEPIDRDNDNDDVVAVSSGLEMGLGAGGRITQKVYRDPYGAETWDTGAAHLVFVRLLNGEEYQALTGRALPPTGIDARTYTEHGLPWFAVYDESRPGLAAGVFDDVESIGEIDRRAGRPPDLHVDVPDEQVTTVGKRPRRGGG